MDIEVDQSGKIENTRVDTVVAFSDSKTKSILIPAKEKRRLQKIFREAGKSRVFVYRTFAILIFLLIKDDLKDIDYLTIDNEYPGQDMLIKNYLLQEIRRTRFILDKKAISFGRLTKKSPAHKEAYAVYKKNKEPNKVVTIKNTIKFVLK